MAKAKTTNEAKERLKIAESGFKLLSLLTVGGVEKTDWRNLDKKDNVWSDLDATIEDLKDTLLLLKNDYFFDSIFSWYPKLTGNIPEYASRYFLAKCIQHYKECNRPKYNGKGHASKRNKFIKKARYEFDHMIYDVLVKHWGGSRADENLSKGLSDPKSSRNMTKGEEEYTQQLIPALDYDDPKLAGLPYANVDGSHDKDNDWNVGKYDSRSKALFLYHLTLVGCHLKQLIGEKSVDVEHIIAQKSWLDEFENTTNEVRSKSNRCHHFCNLTLLGSSINRAKSHSPPGKLNTKDADEQKILTQLKLVSGVSEKDLLMVNGVGDFKSKLWRSRRNFILYSFSDDHRFKILNAPYQTAGKSSDPGEFPGEKEIPVLDPAEIAKKFSKMDKESVPSWYLSPTP